MNDILDSPVRKLRPQSIKNMASMLVSRMRYSRGCCVPKAILWFTEDKTAPLPYCPTCEHHVPIRKRV
jgi:hypothetical protein